MRKSASLSGVILSLAFLSHCAASAPEALSADTCLAAKPGIKNADCSYEGFVTYELQTYIGNPASSSSTPANGTGKSAVLADLRLVAVSSSGDVYGVEYNNFFGTVTFRIRRLNLADNSATTLYGPISNNLITNCAISNISNVTGAVVANKYYFSCNRAILVYDISTPANPPVVFAGDLTTAGTTDGVTRTAARFNSPQAVIALDNDNLIVADNHALRQVGITADSVTTYLGLIGTTGATNGIGGAARLATPTNIVRSGNNLYVVETGGTRIRRVSTTGPEAFTHANLPSTASFGDYATMVVNGNYLDLFTFTFGNNNAYYHSMSATSPGSFTTLFKIRRSGASDDSIGLAASVRNTIDAFSTLYQGKWFFIDRQVSSSTSANFVRTFAVKPLTY